METSVPKTTPKTWNAPATRGRASACTRVVVVVVVVVAVVVVVVVVVVHVLYKLTTVHGFRLLLNNSTP